jgi:hypothetical protein
MFTLVLEECQDTKGGLPTMAFKIFFEAFLLQGISRSPLLTKNQSTNYVQKEMKFLQHGAKP